MDRESAYYYTRLSELPNFGRVYVYDIVRSVMDSDFGGQLIKIKDEDGSAIVKVVKKSSKYFYDLQVGNILRLHRTELAALRKLIATQDEPHAEDGSPAQSIRVEESCEGSSFKKVADEPVIVDPMPSKSRAKKRSHTDENITEARDIPKLGKQFFNWYAQVLGVYTGKGEPFTVILRVWDGTKPRFSHYRNMFHADKDSIDTVHCEISPSLFSVIESFAVDVCCYGERARKGLVSPGMSDIAECLTASKKLISDVVHLCNVRNYTSLKNGISAVTLHIRGLQYGRCAVVLSRYVEPSTQDSSSLNMIPILPENVLAQSTPLFAKDDTTPRAVCECQRESEGPQTANDFSSDHLDEPTSSHNPFEMLAPNIPVKPTLRNAVDGIAEMDVMHEGEKRDSKLEPVFTRSSRMGSPSPKGKRKSLVTNVDDAVNAELEQNVGIESISQSLHLSESTSMQPQQNDFPSRQRSPSAISASSSPNHIRIDSEESRPPDEQALSTKRGITEDHIRNQPSVVREEDFLSALAEDELFADADVTLVNEIRNLFYKSELKKKLEKWEKLAARTYELRDEFEEILKQKIGDRICLVNSVEASVTTMEELDYLRHAIIFTAKCLICNHEFVVERATKTWCVKCFSERKRLSQVVHSYRITVPCVYC